MNPSSSNTTSGVKLANGRKATNSIKTARNHFEIGLRYEQRCKTLQNNGTSICYHKSNATHGLPSLGLATQLRSGDLTPLGRLGS